jgi:acid phosphatase type 7
LDRREPCGVHYAQLKGVNKNLFFFALIFSYVSAAFSAVVTRGPYLQSSTTSSIVIRWRTDVATDSRVQYGITQGSLTSSIDDASFTTEHEVKITGLNADTKYFYSVGTTSGVLAGNNSNHFFVTHPPQGTAKSTRIWAIGDFGFGNVDQAAVRNAYYAYTGTRQTDLWLMLGDNAYDTGLDSEYQTRCFMMYTNMFQKSVVWPTIGNHDVSNGLTPLPYTENFTLPTQGEAGGLASGSERYYSFNYGNIHFICLNTMDPTIMTTSSAMNTWLSNDLAANSSKWLIAYWHHPVYTKGTSDSDKTYEPRRAFLAKLEAAGVDLVLTGHSHSYERTYFIDGFTGQSTDWNPSTYIKVPGSGRLDGPNGAYIKQPGPHNGAVFVVDGSSGTLGGGPLNHPAMYTSQNVLGSFVIDINGNQLDAKFITSTGAIGDYFTIIKGSGGTQVLTSITVSPTPASVSPGSTQQFTAVAKDQSGLPMSTQPSFTWTFSGSAANGSINSSGLFTGGSSEGGPFTITASAGGKSGTAQVTVASSTTVTFQDGVGGYAGTIDTTMDETSVKVEGSSVRMNVDFEAGVENRQALFKFDLTSIPTDATVTAASIVLTSVRANSVGSTETLQLQKITSSWNESIVWSSGLPSNVPTGITLPLPSSAMPTNSFVISGMKDIVQDWVKSPAQNFGVMINTAAKINYDFATRESTTIAYHPKISITYSTGVVNPDTDSDGLPDAWETTNFGSLAQNAAGDSDGDGISNAAEYSAGTSPVDRSSRLAITSEQVTGANQFTVTWQSTVGKSYVVESSSDCVSWGVAGNVSASGSTSTWTDSSASSSRKFYRIKLP